MPWSAMRSSLSIAVCDSKPPAGFSPANAEVFCLTNGMKAQFAVAQFASETKKEIRLPDTDKDEVIAAKIGRTTWAVCLRGNKLRIPGERERRRRR